MVQITSDELEDAGRSDDGAFDLMRKVQRWSGARLYIYRPPRKGGVTYILTWTSVRPGPNIEEVR
jgi:hypothetical protein